MSDAKPLTPDQAIDLAQRIGRLTLIEKSTDGTRPDGFAQSDIDRVKAEILAITPRNASHE